MIFQTQVRYRVTQKGGVIIEHTKSGIACATKCSTNKTRLMAMVNRQFSSAATYLATSSVWGGHSVTAFIVYCCKTFLTVGRVFALTVVKQMIEFETFTSGAVMSNLRTVVALSSFGTDFSNVEVRCLAIDADAWLTLCGLDALFAVLRETASAFIELVERFTGIAFWTLFHNVNNNIIVGVGKTGG